MKKLVNKRPILFFSIAFLVASIIFVYCYTGRLVIILSSISVVVLIAAAIPLIVNIKVLRTLLSRFFLASLAVLMAVCTISISRANYQKDYVSFSGTAVVSGRICDVGQIYNSDRLRINVDQATIVNQDYSQKLVNKVSLVIIVDGFDKSVIKVGNIVDISARISYVSLDDFDKSRNYYYINKDISVYGYATEKNISVASSDNLKLSERIKNKIENIISGNLDQEYQGLAMGMLFGDRDVVDATIGKDFSAVGISHLLAVSGLHVGLLLSILMLICKLLKLKGVLKFGIVSAILLFYAYLCGFSVSVTRAVIMSICSLYAVCRGKRYDSLNALATAMVIVLAIWPYSLATVGFRLSFCAVLGIILLARPISDLLSKVVFKGFADAVAVTISATVSTSVIIASSFNNFTTLSFFANFIVVPLASIAYGFLFFGVWLGLIFNFLSPLVYGFEIVLSPAIKFVHLIAPVKALAISQTKANYLTFVQLFALTYSSYYIFIDNRKLKTYGSILLWLIFFVILFI